MTNHVQTEIYNPFYDEIIEVDSGMTRILSKLWELGLQTHNSCQDNNGSVWIEFDLECGKKFFEILTKHYLTFDCDFNHKHDLYIDDITLRINTDDCVQDPNEEDSVISTGDVRWTLSVRFPQHHFPYVLSAIRLYKSKQVKDTKPYLI